MQQVKNYWNGAFQGLTGRKIQQVFNPATGDVIAETPLSAKEDLDLIVESASKAFLAWKATPVTQRVQPLFRLKELLEKNANEIARTIVQEHGKTFSEAQGDLRRGIQNVEVACGMPAMLLGDMKDNVASEIDSFTIREPLGVCAAITPFNFPAMVPFWFWPYAVATGNTCIVKPSEVVPLTQMRIFELVNQCGFPPGVINMVHGGKDCVEAILEHPKIKAISFVGSTPVAKLIYTEGSARGKRVQALGGAKNFLVMLPDAPRDKAIAAMVDSCLGCAGERCLAGSVLIGVGEAYDALKKDVLEYVKRIRVGDGMDPQTTMGPVISASARDRIKNDIQQAIQEGAEILVDGRQTTLPQGKGFYLGPTVFDKVKPGTTLATKEIFGPVIGLMSVQNLDEAISIINESSFGNTCSLFTSSGGAARKFCQEVEPAMIGINLGVPAPMSMFSFGGSKDSFFGDIKAQGWSSVEFFTQKKTTMQRWFSGSHDRTSPHW